MADKGNSLTTGCLGTCVLVANDVTLPCAELNYSMQINAMHAATVVVYAGTSLLHPDSSTGEAAFSLMRTVKQAAGKGGGLVYCTLQERLPYGDTAGRTIFKGYITEAVVVYRSGPPMTVGIKFTCAGPAAKLLAAPCSSYIPSTIDKVIARLGNGQSIDFTNAAASGHDYQNGVLDIDGRIEQLCARLPIARRIAICVDCAKIVATMGGSKQYTNNGDTDTLAAIGGKVNLKLDDGLDFCDGKFSKSLWDGIVGGFTHDNILYSIKSTVCTDSFMLQLVPRWTVDEDLDFRLELTPVTVWDNGRSIVKLTADDIAGISTGYVATDPLITPDIVLANFNQMFAYTQDAKSSLSLGVIGVACMDKTLEQTLRNSVSSGKNPLNELITKEKLFRVREISAPGWLIMVCRNRQKTTSASASQEYNVAGDMKTLVVPETTEGQPAQVLSTNAINTPTAAANMLAEALMLHHYMVANTCSVSLLPSARFGYNEAYCLENSLGSLVEIDLSGSAAMPSTRKIRGELAGISLSATYGKTGSMRYDIQLSRVHDESITDRYACPIYTV